jgi:allantoinase
VLLPGLVDMHVHFSEPGRTHWEGFLTGTRAAAAGGVTTIVDMPLNAMPPTIDVASYRLKHEAAASSAIVDYALWGGLVDDNRAELEALLGQEVIGLKAFLCSATDYPRVNDDILVDGLLAARRHGRFVAVHAENEWVTRSLTDRLRAAGRTDRRAWGEARPIAAELEAIRRSVHWAAATGGRLHVVHVSCAAGIDEISAAKARGAQVTAETCPHYLFFSEDDLVRIGPLAKCAPPLRSPSEVEVLWERVLAGDVDVIASDHSPCLIEEKRIGDDDIFKAWGGISGLQSTLPVLLTEGVHRRGLRLEELVRMTSSEPARMIGAYPAKGALLAGSDADFVLLDLDAEFTLRAEDLLYKNKHSAYVGATMKGRVHQTWLRGKLVASDGKVMGQPGAGRLVASSSAPRSAAAQ